MIIQHTLGNRFTKKNRRKEYKGMWPYCRHSTPHFGCWIGSKIVSSDCHFKVQDSFWNADVIRGPLDTPMDKDRFTQEPVALHTQPLNGHSQNKNLTLENKIWWLHIREGSRSYVSNKIKTKVTFNISPEVRWKALHKRLLINPLSGHPLILIITTHPIHNVLRQTAMPHPLLRVSTLNSHLLQPQCEGLEICLTNPKKPTFNN